MTEIQTDNIMLSVTFSLSQFVHVPVAACRQLVGLESTKANKIRAVMNSLSVRVGAKNIRTASSL